VKTAGMSSYPIVLKDEFCIIFLIMSTDLSHTRFGTSSWAYEGWQGLVYQRPYPKSRFSQDTLTEYAGYAVDGVPLFPTVGIDHSFCQSASTRQLAHYAEQVPEHFRFCSEVWEEITIPAYPNLPRYGAKAGKPNPLFLDTGAFRDMVWAPAPARRIRRCACKPF
jgi:uncharacterized protein YecE (DUF72 family)